jgi:CheY-like chemotaxis protein
MPRRGAILVVEDRDDVRQGLTQLLELHGFDVRQAATGMQALQQLFETPSEFALILLDLLLPGALSGAEVRERQLADRQTAPVPVVILSACEPDDDAQDRLRAAAWLEKPFRFDALLPIVQRYVLPEQF